jgi:ATP-binding cassette subfamily G (WHITE) protein 5 (sterolin 1)
VQAYASSQHARETEEAIEACRSTRSGEHVFVKRSRLSFFGSVNILMRRMFVNLVRDANGLQLRAVQYVALGFLLWIFMGKMGQDQNSVQNRFGYLYQATVAGLFLGILSAVGLFPDVRDVYYRESRDGMYSASAFVLSYTLHALPTDIISTALFCAWSVGVMGLQGGVSNFFINLFALACGVNVGESLAMVFLLIYQAVVRLQELFWTSSCFTF